MIEQLRGIVIRVTDVSDFDRMLTLLTAEHGKISVYVRGAKRPNNRFLTASQLFCCGDYTLYRGKHDYTLNDCATVESFFHLRDDVETLSLATYFCEVASDVCLEESDEHSMMQLLLNALWTLQKGELPQAQIKAAYEFRCACIIGFLPQIGACRMCGKEFGERRMMFDLLDGTVICDCCHEKLPVPETPYADDQGALCRPVSNSVMAALRYVVTTGASRQFSFRLEPEEMHNFAMIAESYLLSHVEHGYHSLSFYKSIVGS